METIKNALDSLKEFIWDIIGYFLPGAYLIILLAFSLGEAYLIHPKIFANTEMMWPLFIISSYLLGHVTYGLGQLKENLLGRWSYTRKKEKEVSLKPAFKTSKELLEKALIAKGVNQDLNNASVRDVRSLIMSFAPETDQKVYTFTFRSDLSNQIGNISALVGLLAILSSFISRLQPRVFVVDRPHLLLYFCLLLSYIFVRQARNRFYSISISVPFSVYTAKELKSTP